MLRHTVKHNILVHIKSPLFSQYAFKYNILVMKLRSTKFELLSGRVQSHCLPVRLSASLSVRLYFCHNRESYKNS